jgi:hypothetical protein
MKYNCHKGRLELPGIKVAKGISTWPSPPPAVGGRGVGVEEGVRAGVKVMAADGVKVARGLFGVEVTVAVSETVSVQDSVGLMLTLGVAVGVSGKVGVGFSVKTSVGVAVTVSVGVSANASAHKNQAPQIQPRTKHVGARACRLFLKNTRAPWNRIVFMRVPHVYGFVDLSNHPLSIRCSGICHQLLDKKKRPKPAVFFLRLIFSFLLF